MWTFLWRNGGITFSTPNSLPQLTVAAGRYSYANALCLSLVLGQRSFHCGAQQMSLPSMRNYFFIYILLCSCWNLLLSGHWSHWARLPNFVSSSPLRLPRVLPSSFYVAGLLHHMLTVCRPYVVGLPLSRWPTSNVTVIIFLIVIVFTSSSSSSSSLSISCPFRAFTFLFYVIKFSLIL